MNRNQTSMTIPNVPYTMRAPVLVAIALSLWACNPPQEPTKVGGTDTDRGAGPSSSSNGTGKAPENPAPHDLSANKVPDIKFSPDTFEVKKPGSGDWRKAAKPPAEIMDSVDKAMRQPVPSIALADTNFEVGGATLAGKSTVKIKDGRTYAIEFYTPESRATLNRIISDGSHKAKFVGEKWTTPETPSAPDASPVDEPTLKNWPTQFMRTMFSPYDTGHSVWGPLVRYWQKTGTAVSVEERTSKMKDGRRYYRIVGTAKDGSQVEIHIDGLRNLPILVRTVTVTGPGRSDKRMWSAAWQFGGTFDAKEFAVPGVPASSSTRPGP